jgi:hypothetical protein
MAKQPVQFVGGSFAPPLTDAKLAGYRDLIDALPASPVKDAMNTLHACCVAWWALPESTGKGEPHPSGTGTIVDLDRDAKTALSDLLPWAHELDAMGRLFDGIDPVGQKTLRDAAFHLLWHAKELEQDREPITTDRL